jgi:hypothetical protein
LSIKKRHIVSTDGSHEGDPKISGHPNPAWYQHHLCQTKYDCLKEALGYTGYKNRCQCNQLNQYRRH